MWRRREIVDIVNAHVKKVLFVGEVGDVVFVGSILILH
jgi:hypothetical protein